MPLTRAQAQKAARAYQAEGDQAEAYQASDGRWCVRGITFSGSRYNITTVGEAIHYGADL
jgi:hypothetical protein